MSALLAIEGLRKAYGALVVTDGVDLDVRPGEIHALIGPNGAGKTTLISLISGEVRPDAGRILIEGRDVTGLPIHRRAKAGLARSFQITSIIPSFPALENVVLALQGAGGPSFRLLPAPRAERAWREEALALLARVGLAGRRRRPPPHSAMGRSARWNWPWPSPASRACCCWTSPWPAPGRMKAAPWWTSSPR